MGKIKVTTCEIEGLYVIEPTVFKDERGYFMETYNQNDFKEAGLNMTFVQDNQCQPAQRAATCRRSDTSSKISLFICSVIRMWD